MKKLWSKQNRATVSAKFSHCVKIYFAYSCFLFFYFFFIKFFRDKFFFKQHKKQYCYSASIVGLRKISQPGNHLICVPVGVLESTIFINLIPSPAVV